MDLKKIKAIINQQDLKSITSLKLFLKFYNYYRKFIVNQLSKIELFIIKTDYKNLTEFLTTKELN